MWSIPSSLLCDSDVSLFLPPSVFCVFPPDTSRTASPWRERIWNTTLSGCSWRWRWSASSPPHANSKMGYVIFTTFKWFQSRSPTAGESRLRNVKMSAHSSYGVLTTNLHFFDFCLWELVNGSKYFEFLVYFFFFLSSDLEFYHVVCQGWTELLTSLR